MPHQSHNYHYNFMCSKCERKGIYNTQIDDPADVQYKCICGTQVTITGGTIKNV